MATKKLYGTRAEQKTINRFCFQTTMVAILLVFASCVYCVAQSISPVSSTFTGGGKGDLTLTNNLLDPMIVSIEAVNFVVGTDKKIAHSALDPHTHIRFSKSGVRIGPKDSAHVFFDASADSYPAWFMIYATFRSANPHPGFNYVMQLGHPVYMYQKEPIPQSDVTLQKATFDPATHMLRIWVENHGDKLARPYLSFPQLHDNEYRLRLFPVFPRQTTMTYFDLSHLDVLKDAVPQSIVVEFDHFKLSGSVTVEQGGPERSAVPVGHTVPAVSTATVAPTTHTTEP